MGATPARDPCWALEQSARQAVEQSPDWQAPAAEAAEADEDRAEEEAQTAPEVAEEDARHAAVEEAVAAGVPVGELLRERRGLIHEWAVLPRMPAWVVEQPALRYAALGACTLLTLNVLVAVAKAARRTLSPQYRRQRTVNRNQLVVSTLAQYLPGNREGMAPGVLGSLRFRTGFTSVEVFRKFLWYLLRERAFKQDVVDDLLALKKGLGLTDPEVAEAIKERAQRIYDKYGTVMFDTAGMTGAGIERKATSRALFSKLQYLTQVEDLVAPEAAHEVDLRKIFGATEDDAARLRIVSLQEVDLEQLMEGESASRPSMEQFEDPAPPADGQSSQE